MLENMSQEMSCHMALQDIEEILFHDVDEK